jgi:hypothetical protein
MFVVSSRDHGRLNHVTSKNAMEAPEVVLAKIDVEGAPTIVLFDSGATYSYVTSKFVQQQSFLTEHRGRFMITSSALGDVSCTLVCKSVRLKMAEYVFLADLTILKYGLVDQAQGFDLLLPSIG